MKFKKLLGGGLLAAVLALGVGAGLAVRGESQEVKASTMSRVNFLTMSSDWKDADATTFLYIKNGQSAWLRTDSDIGSTVKIGSNTYTLYTGFVDLDNLGTEERVLTQRYNPTGDTYWGAEFSDPTTATIRTKERNTFEIVGNWSDGFWCNWWSAKYWKVTTYSGLKDYSDLTDATINHSFTYENDSIADPTVVPTGTSFAHWCTDAALQNEWDGSTITSDLTLYAKYSTNVFDITKKIYHDDTYASQSVDHAEEGQSYTPATPADETGYVFKGWFEYDSINDKPSSTPVTTIASVTSSQTICGVYASRSSYKQDKYIYYVTTVDYGETSPNSIYTFGTNGHEEFGSYGGSLISSVGEEVHGVLDFQGNTAYGKTTLIYKIPYTSVFNDDHLIINYNNSTTDKTADMLLVPGSAYWWSSDPDYHNDAAGAAIDFLIAAENVRNNADYKGLADSVCGISKDDAEDLLEMYDALDSNTQQTYVDCTTAYTYDPLKSADEQKTSKTETTVKYSLIVEKLREIASGNGPSTNTKGISLFGDIDNSTPIMLVVIISVVSLTAVGGYIFLKRRKEN